MISGPLTNKIAQFERPLLSIVIPNARQIPFRLIRQLQIQCLDGDEIILVRNRPRRAHQFWTGIDEAKSHSPQAEARGSNPETHRRTAVAAPSSNPLFRILRSHAGGASGARNLGWQSAKNGTILFLDDDVLVSTRFLSKVREITSQQSAPGVTTFRTVSRVKNRWSDLIEATASPDRGTIDHSSIGRSLLLKETWTYCSSAFVSDRTVLERTGGFKREFGAGIKNGGAEDTEFLWHTSRHATVRYDGHVRVSHMEISRVNNLRDKLVEYGRAIGNLGGAAGRPQGSEYMKDYCTYLIDILDRLGLLELSKPSIRTLSRAIEQAISETISAYRSSLRGSTNRVLCGECR